MANRAPITPSYEVEDPISNLTLRMSGSIKLTDGVTTPHPDLTIYDFSHEPWRADAACIEHPNRSVFFSSQATGSRFEAADMKAQAIELCRVCPVRWECLATSVRQQFGIWGGYDETERRRMRKRVQANTRLDLDELTHAIVEEGMRVEMVRLRGVGERKKRRK
jgi:WhiB family redox-sensing transcriptional regulator